MKLVVILLAVIALGGLVIGLGYAGVLYIPGISAVKKRGAKPQVVTNVVTQAPTVQPPAPKITQPQTQTPIKPPPDGTDRVAKLWSSLDVESIQKILDKWPSGETLPILAKMNDEKLAELLAKLPPAKAAELSRNLKALPKGGK